MQNIVTFGVICFKIMYAQIKKSIAKKKCGESNEDVNIYYAQLSVAIIVLYDEIEFICNKT